MSGQTVRLGGSFALVCLMTACSGSFGAGGPGSGSGSGSGAGSGKADEVFAVGVTPVRVGPISRSLAASGTLKGVREVEILSQADGLVEERLVDVGDVVRARQVLAKLDRRMRVSSRTEAEFKLTAAGTKLGLAEMAVAEQRQAIDRAELRTQDADIGLEKATLASNEAERSYRTKEKLDQRTMSTDERERLKLAMEQGKQDVERAKNAIAQAKLDATSAVLKLSELEKRGIEAAREIEEARLLLERADLELAKADVVATIDGVVTECLIERGGRIAPGAICYRIVDSSRFFVDLRLPEAELAVLAVGQTAALHAGVAPTPVLGRLDRIEPSVDPRTGTVGIRIAVPAPLARLPAPLAWTQLALAARLRRGVFVRVEVQVATHDQAKLVPTEAIVFENQLPHVYLVREEKAHRVEVKLGFSRDDVVEVIAPEVTAGSVVITAGQRLVQPGSTVRVVAGGS